MLFHRRPDFLLDWLHSPTAPCFMRDIEDAYGYSRSLMTELAQAPVPERLNVGLCGLRSDGIDWDLLERWCKNMLQREGPHYLHEQALVALMVARQTWLVAPETYIVGPARRESEHPTAVLHHYVAESKAWYFRFAWQKWAGRTPLDLERIADENGFRSRGCAE